MIDINDRSCISQQNFNVLSLARPHKHFNEEKQERERVGQTEFNSNERNKMNTE